MGQLPKLIGVENKMVTSKTIVLKNAKKVFPEKFTKARAHDLISISVEKKEFLSKKEQTKLQSVADEIRMGLFKNNKDVMVTRIGRKIKITPL